VPTENRQVEQIHSNCGSKEGNGIILGCVLHCGQCGDASTSPPGRRFQSTPSNFSNSAALTFVSIRRFNSIFSAFSRLLSAASLSRSVSIFRIWSRKRSTCARAAGIAESVFRDSIQLLIERVSLLRHWGTAHNESLLVQDSGQKVFFLKFRHSGVAPSPFNSLLMRKGHRCRGEVDVERGWTTATFSK
jgi:hypothetical protein